MNLRFKLLAGLLLFLPLFSSASTNSFIAFSEKAPPAGIGQAAPVICWTEAKDTPRPVRMHFTRIDLLDTNCEVFTIISDAPADGGTAEAILEDPEKLAADNSVLAAVNANGFQSLKTTKTQDDNNWSRGRPINIVGLVISNGIVRSKQSGKHFALWFDFENKPHIGNPDTNDRPREAVSDLSGLLVHKGETVNDNNERLHPRTLIGYDKTRRWFFFAVVDGRQPEYSEGMYLSESAELMKNLGCYEAIAMDGGASSIMIALDPSTGKLVIRNKLIEKQPRPIAVMLGVRQRTGRK